jgi:hypothetical protein
VTTGLAERRLHDAAATTATPVPRRAQVEGSGTGVKFRKMEVAFDDSEKAPPPRLFAKDAVLSVKSVVLNPVREAAESSVHW